MKKHWILPAIGMCLIPSAASAMSVADFLVRADALKSKGAMAMFSPSEIEELKTEVQAAAGAYRTDVDAAQARKDKSFGCPPPKGKARIGTEELLASFRKIPDERRKSVTVKAGLYDFMKSQYPCK